MMVKLTISMLLFIFAGGMAFATLPVETEIKFVRTTKGISVQLNSRKVIVPHELLKAHFRESLRLHTWWFVNKVEDSKFVEIAKSHPGEKPMSVARAVEKREKREFGKLNSLIEFYCATDRRRNACESSDISRLRELGRRLDASFASQANLGEINRIIDRLIEGMLDSKIEKRTAATGTIPYLILRSYLQDIPNFDFAVVPAKSFELQTKELTQSEWFQVMGTNPSFFSDREDCPATHVSVQGTELCSDFPVETFRFAELRVLIDKLNYQQSKHRYRIPTDAEWEYSSRAGTTTRFSFGESEAPIAEYAWSHQNRISHPMKVGMLKPNPWGFFDMHGNVWEFVRVDKKWSKNPTKEPGFTVRGGSWIDAPGILANSLRYEIYDSWTCYDVGIRLAR